MRSEWMRAFEVGSCPDARAGITAPMFARRNAAHRAIYLVPPAFVEDPSDVVAAFLGQARRSGVGSVVALSSMGVAFPYEPQDSGRRNVERAVRESGLQWTILRATGFAQNFSEGFLLPAILQAGAVATATGTGAVANYLYVDEATTITGQSLVSD